MDHIKLMTCGLPRLHALRTYDSVPNCNHYYIMSNMLYSLKGAYLHIRITFPMMHDHGNYVTCNNGACRVSYDSNHENYHGSKFNSMQSYIIIHSCNCVYNPTNFLHE